MGGALFSGILLVGAMTAETRLSETLELWVELADTTGLDQRVIAGLREEVDQIYGTAGVAIRWLEESPDESGSHIARVYLMEELPASLSSRLRAFHPRGAPTMALGLGTEGKVSGAVLYVSRRGVSARATNGGLSEPSPEVLARALGRVIAHELAHRFLQKKHTRHGVLRADFSQSDLVGNGGWAEFSKNEAARIRTVAYKRPGQRRP